MMIQATINPDSKLKIHLPRKFHDWLLFGLFWFGGIWLILFELYFVSPHYHSSWNSALTFHLIFAVIVAANIYMNMYMMISTNVSCRQFSLCSSPLPVGWKFCKECQIYTPPRSHHCKLCNDCILKRDHHCFFAGYCVGYFNHRYFLSMVVYMTIAAFYCNIYNWQFYMAVKGGFTWTTIPGIIAPHLGLMMGYYTMYEFFITAHIFAGLLLNLLFLTLFITQLAYCSTGQLYYEKKKGIMDYHVGAKKTIEEVFGSAGLIVLVCPLIASKLPGNGAHFPPRKDDGAEKEEGNKKTKIKKTK